MRDVPMARHSLRSCRIVWESMAPTMKSGVHENRNENLHGWRNFEKCSCSSDVSIEAWRSDPQPFSQVKGFMMPMMKGS
jgi:hypothetical protein